MAAVQEWHHSGSDCCSPFSTCLISWCIPCVAYGRIHHRLHKNGQLQDWSFCNGDCIGYGVLMHCGLQWILQMMQRSEVRKRYGLQGNGCKDCLCACCCGPCDLTQQDKEVEYREDERAGLVSVQPNKMGAHMQYPPQGGYPAQQTGYVHQ